MTDLKHLTLNVIVPTYNRADSLRRTLQSLADATPAATLHVTVTVADNNSTDKTRETVEEFAPLFTKARLEYIFEKRQGRSFALNAALQKTKADLIATVDDDEEVNFDWYVHLAQLFGSRWDEIDFASGKMLPRWQTEPPPVWASQRLPGIGWRDFGEEEWEHTFDTPIVCGGHAIYKRSIFDELGFFTEGLGATGKNLMSCEDDVIYDKLLVAGKKGVYSPHLIIWHFVPDYRLTPNYFRQWCFGNGASQHLVDVYYKKFEGARLFGVPRYMYREAAASLWKTLKTNFSNRRCAFVEEHGLWVFWGYFYERNIKDSRIESPFRFVAKLLPSAAR